MQKPAIDSIDPKIKHETHLDAIHQIPEEPLIIGIDGNEANVENRVGSNKAANRILQELYKLTTGDADFDQEKLKIRQQYKWIIYLKNHPLSHLPEENEYWQYKVIPFPYFWTQTRLPFELYKSWNTPHVFFSPGHYAPRFCPCPRVITILDTAFFEFADQFKKQDLIKLKTWTARSVKQADHIIAISQHTKNDIVKHYGKFEKQITVAHMGINTEQFFFPQSDKKINAVKQKYNIDSDYIIYVGTLQPRKNLPNLIEAFKLAKDARKGKTPKDESINFDNLKLVIAGKKGWLYDEIFNKAKELEMEDEIVFTDFVDQADLPPLIAGARCLAQVALYEGFGIPVVEALAVGTPAVVSNVSSLPEVLGNAGYHVNPRSVEDIADKLGKMLDLSSEEYYELAEKGIRHSHLFRWHKTAETVLKVLEHTAGLPT